jgi:hypothetical protein
MSGRGGGRDGRRRRGDRRSKPEAAGEDVRAARERARLWLAGGAHQRIAATADRAAAAIGRRARQVIVAADLRQSRAGQPRQEDQRTDSSCHHDHPL